PAPIVEDARSRLSEAQRTFEATLASIKATEGETSEALDRARAAEQRAIEALRTAEEDRRRARRERDEAIRAARAEADRVVDDLRTELAATRRAVERETVTASSLDAAMGRAEAIADRLPALQPAQPEPLAETRSWTVGDRARSRAGGWEGRIAAMDRDGRRATLDAGGMRVAVDLDDLIEAIGRPSEPAGGTGLSSRTTPDTNAASLRMSRARTVASSLDLRGARVEEALESLGRYLDDASLAGLASVLVIHGLGTGALRDAVRSEAASHPLVKSVRAGERGEGGDGATIVSL
ncbi:MAG: Smr/MutS family protein, partial [Candidatus Limnocylindrales bacterium]